MTNKTSFVIMSIQAPGSPEHEHYKAIYETVLDPALRSMHYDPVRADKIQASGAIDRDIILRLATSDLVVADLTGLNPNVFYELGVRHALRQRGTIMILDKLVTQNIPFDVRSYRVIEFEGNLEGIGKLRLQIEAFARSLEDERSSVPDNPVHSWLPALPENALASSGGSVEKELRRKIGELEGKLQIYRARYGLREEEEKTADPLEVVRAALAEVSGGSSPFDLLRRAEHYTQQQNLQGFLESVKEIFGMKLVQLSGEQYLSLAGFALRLGLDEVTDAIYEHALTIHPSYERLREAQLRYFATSPHLIQRERAKQELSREIGLIIHEDGTVEVPAHLNSDALRLLMVTLDAYITGGDNVTPLTVTEALIQKYGDRTVVARNRGRALRLADRIEEALTWYQRAIWCSDANDTSVSWFAGVLHDEKRYVDSLETYLLASSMDPNDATYFANVADELSLLPQGADRFRVLPSEIASDLMAHLRKALLAAISCSDVGQHDIETCRRASQRVDIDFDSMLRQLSVNSETDAATMMSTILRRELASSLYRLLKSAVTVNPGET